VKELLEEINNELLTADLVWRKMKMVKRVQSQEMNRIMNPKKNG
jgi:hypothetical protein